MNEVVDFFIRLFQTNSWPARWNCGTWSDFHGWLYIASDLIIWLAYFMIPVIIIWFIQKKPEMPFLPVFWLFGAFIVLCGATHLIDAVIFWWPAYRLSAFLRLLTAIISMVTVFALIRDLPKALNITASKPEKNDNNKLHELKKSWQDQLAEKDQVIDKLEKEIENLKKSHG